jgi:hypothetical protein
MKRKIKSFSLLKILFFSIFLFLLGNFIQAQQDSFRLASPKIGINQLAIKVLGIEFNQNQRDSLNGKSVELIYSVDFMGIGKLEEVNGVKDQSILDSIFKANEPFIAFNPEIFNGEPREALYFLQVHFPKYNKSINQPVIIDRFSFNFLKIDDFDTLHLSKNSSSILIGGLMNQFLGHANQYLGFGGGMKMDILYKTPNILVGLNLNIYGSKRKKDFVISHFGQQANYPSILLIGPTIGYIKRRWSLAAELDYLLFNIIYNTSDKVKDGYQVNGSSFGLIYSYRLPVARQKPFYYYNMPYILSQNISFTLGVRRLEMKVKEASGIMIDFGLHYELDYRGIKKFRLKNQIN